MFGRPGMVVSSAPVYRVRAYRLLGVTPHRPGMRVSMPQTRDIASCAVSGPAKVVLGFWRRASGERGAVGPAVPSPAGKTGSGPCRASAERLAAAGSLTPGYTH
jgi:hypothetical protein